MQLSYEQVKELLDKYKIKKIKVCRDGELSELELFQEKTLVLNTPPTEQSVFSESPFPTEDFDSYFKNGEGT